MASAMVSPSYPAAAAMSLARLPSFPDGLRVLLLEVDSRSQRATKALLHECSFIVTCSRSLKDTITTLKRAAISLTSGGSQRYDLVLVDLRVLGDLDGAVATSLAQSAAAARTALLLMGESCSREHIMAAVEMGAADCLEKPLSTTKLRNIWQHTVRRRMSGAKLPPPQLPSTPPSTAARCPTPSLAAAAAAPLSPALLPPSPLRLRTGGVGRPEYDADADVYAGAHALFSSCLDEDDEDAMAGLVACCSFDASDPSCYLDDMEPPESCLTGAASVLLARSESTEQLLGDSWDACGGTALPSLQASPLACASGSLGSLGGSGCSTDQWTYSGAGSNRCAEDSCDATSGAATAAAGGALRVAPPVLPHCHSLATVSSGGGSGGHAAASCGASPAPHAARAPVLTYSAQYTQPLAQPMVAPAPWMMPGTVPGLVWGLPMMSTATVPGIPTTAAQTPTAVPVPLMPPPMCWPGVMPSPMCWPGMMLAPPHPLMAHAVAPACRAAQHAVAPACGAAQHAIAPACGAAQHATATACGAAQHAVAPACGAAQHATASLQVQATSLPLQLLQVQQQASTSLAACSSGASNASGLMLSGLTRSDSVRSGPPANANAVLPLLAAPLGAALPSEPWSPLGLQLSKSPSLANLISESLDACIAAI